MSIRSALIRAISTSFYWSGAHGALRWCARHMMPARAGQGAAGFPFVTKRKSRNLQILTYHRVNNEGDPIFPALPVEVFENQMRHLARWYHICALDEAIEQAQRGDLPDNAVVITFDDGYRDNYLHAFPVLKSLDLPMTIFLATDAIGTGVTLWHDRVFSAFRETKRSKVEGFERTLEGLPLVTVSERRFAMGKVLAALRQLNEAERNSRINVLCEALEVSEKSVDNDLMLSWDDVRIMQKHRVSFGSHTASHPILSRLSREETEQQVERSCDAIRRHLGARPSVFAYPNGTSVDFTPMTKDVLKAAGFRCAVTTEFGVNESGVDPFELKRGGPWETHLPTFALKLDWYRLMSSHPA